MTRSDKNRPGTPSTGAARHNTATARTFDDVLQELEARHRRWDRDHETPDATAWRDHYTNTSPAWQTALADANTAGHKSGSIEAWDQVVALVQELLITYGRLLERLEATDSASRRASSDLATRKHVPGQGHPTQYHSH